MAILFVLAGTVIQQKRTVRESMYLLVIVTSSRKRSEKSMLKNMVLAYCIAEYNIYVREYMYYRDKKSKINII